MSGGGGLLLVGRRRLTGRTRRTALCTPGSWLRRGWRGLVVWFTSGSDGLALHTMRNDSNLIDNYLERQVPRMSRSLRLDLIDELGVESRAQQRATDALDDAVAAELGVNRTDLRCLDVLLQMGTGTPGQLASALGLTSGSVTALLDRLEKRGYLGRSADPSDRRRVMVRPSAELVKRAAEIYGPLATEGNRRAARYSVSELKLLIDFLRSSRELQENHLARIAGSRQARR